MNALNHRKNDRFTLNRLPSPDILHLGCLHAEQVMIERFETYPKQTCRNRCYIYGPNGLQTLSIPVIKVNGNHTLTKDIRIATSTPWQRLHLRSIETAYNNSPFFLYYKDEFEKVFEKQFDFLLDLNTHLLEILLSILRIEKKIGFTDHFLMIPDGMENHRESSKKRRQTSKRCNSSLYPGFQSTARLHRRSEYHRSPLQSWTRVM